jgi:hypothetical protein
MMIEQTTIAAHQAIIPVGRRWNGSASSFSIDG